MTEFDYIIVGAGSAGCVLALRLSEGAPGAKILVLEAGGSDRDPLIHVPLGIGIMHEWRSHDWGYDTEPEPGLGGRSIEAMRGKVVGGSSSINHMSWVRGNRGDYDRWAMAGLDGWSYRDVLPYFRRSETWEGGADAYRGGDGPLRIQGARTTDPLFDAYRAAAEAQGYAFTPDHNGARQDGVSRSQSCIYKGRRQSAAVAYLRPALARGNVTLVARAQATRVILQGTRATGIEYLHRGQRRVAHAAREVILSGGVFNSPQLLMLSGIGPADHLTATGIAPRLDLPGVGGNLQDHIAAMVTGTRPEPGPFVREMRVDRMPFSMVRAYLFGSGPATVLPSGLHGYIRTEPGLDAPDIQFIYRGVSTAPHLWFPGIRKPEPDRCGVRPILLHPESRGTVRLRSDDPLAPVEIRQNFFVVSNDMARLRRGVRLARELLAEKALDRFRGAEIAPGPKRESDADLDAWIRATALTAHHPSGTCAMGTGDTAVLDNDLRVRGAEGLRVVDASAMPDLVSGNINACVIMVAEKAADAILGRPAATPAAV
jgi:choline dehydrogenase-like flavoprotein